MNHYEILLACVCVTIYVIGVMSLKYVFSDGMPRLWRRGVLAGLLILSVALIIRFLPEWAKYATLIGLVGIAAKETFLGTVRWREVAGKKLAFGFNRKGWLLVVGLVVIVLCVAGVIAVNINKKQDDLHGEVSQNQDLTRQTIAEIQGLRAEIKEFRAEKKREAQRDSLYKIFMVQYVQGRLAADIAEGKGRDKVKRDLNKWNAATSKVRPVPQLSPLKTTSMAVPERIDPNLVKPFLMPPKGKKRG